VAGINVAEREYMNSIKWAKRNTQLFISECGQYAIWGRYTYYQGWTPYYLPDGEKGEWKSIDGMYKGRGALATCRELCEEHKNKKNIKGE
jgi:hypothetical protein